MPPPRDDLRLLSIFHYVLAALSGLFAIFPLVYVGMGVAFVAGAFEGEPDPPPALVGWMLIAFGLLFLSLVVGYAVGLVLAGRFLSRQRHWMFCMVMAGLSCPSFPFGTALGVFTIVTLAKPEVKALFTVQPTTVVAP